MRDGDLIYHTNIEFYSMMSQQQRDTVVRLRAERIKVAEASGAIQTLNTMSQDKIDALSRHYGVEIKKLGNEGVEK